MSEGRPRPEHYYEARGFSVYYLANAIFNIVNSSGAYLRGIEDILGDMRVLTLMRPFHRYTNLHPFIRGRDTLLVPHDVGEEDFGHQCSCRLPWFWLGSVEPDELGRRSAELHLILGSSDITTVNRRPL